MRIWARWGATSTATPSTSGPASRSIAIGGRASVTTAAHLEHLHGCTSTSCSRPMAHQRPTGRTSRTVVDRKSVVSGKGVSVRVDLGGGRIIKKKKKKTSYKK